MGLIFGKITVETPKYEVVQSSAEYEIRKYPPSVAAQVIYDPSQFKGNRDGGFTLLANYIGALVNPQNSKPETTAMTAPVITKTSNSEKIAMTAPVEEGERNYGLVKFAGVATDKVVEEKVENLKKSLERDGYKVTGQHLLARYNPPWTIPAFRTNEVMLPVE
ncbi:tubulin beta-1 chain isoform 1 [Hibiscus syriacus]|uniref:Tubulin beta-1 chain isoform 1 n=1 Tax=Hibiscus syriacus TaxID=106335 RepID=A0A6A2X2B4_HIBSY|nr:tubulin beta-1 chain isoform 1 [Hibiscus syriacus]